MDKYNISEAIERVKNAPWYEKDDITTLSFKGNIIASVEVHESNRGVSVECSIFYNSMLGTGPTFDHAFVALENQVGDFPTIKGDVVVSAPKSV